MANITLKLSPESAKILMKHMRWEDVGKERMADVIVQCIYDELERAVQRQERREERKQA